MQVQETRQHGSPYLSVCHIWRWNVPLFMRGRIDGSQQLPRDAEDDISHAVVLSEGTPKGDRLGGHEGVLDGDSVGTRPSHAHRVPIVFHAHALGSKG